MENDQYSEITHKVIGCAMRVHNNLGSGFQEIIYQRALEIEFKKDTISYYREYEMQIEYEGENIGSRRVDFLVDSVVCVELKALSELEDVHLAQAKNYLEAFKLDIGLLINFGGKKLQFHRIFRRKKVKENFN